MSLVCGSTRGSTARNIIFPICGRAAWDCPTATTTLILLQNLSSYAPSIRLTLPPRLLKLAGFADAETRAARILSFETRMARTFAPDSDAADVFKQNPWKRADFDVKAPMHWEAYFKSAGLAGQSDFIVWQPSAVTGISALVDTEDLDQWRDYLRFHLVEHYASVLPRAAAAETLRLLRQWLGGMHTCEPCRRGSRRYERRPGPSRRPTHAKSTFPPRPRPMLRPWSAT